MHHHVHILILVHVLIRVHIFILIVHHHTPSSHTTISYTNHIPHTTSHTQGGIQAHWPFPLSHLELGYAYILTHPGIPCVLYEHFFYDGLGPSIQQLIAVRRRNGIRADSPVKIWTAESDMYVAAIQDADKNDRLVLKLGPRFDMVCVVEEGVYVY